MNLERDFNQQRINLSSGNDEELFATLISSKLNKGNRNCVLYIHGFIDYFFHPHVCEEFHKKNFDFFAIDLRRYGRSLRPHHKPNYCTSIEEYFEEISAAIEIIKNSSNELFLLGHSTGGLISATYLNSGERKQEIAGLILNSPFLDMAQPKYVTNLMYAIIQPLSILFPNGSSNRGLSPIYAESLHQDFNGEWDFNLEWKPIKGYPVYFKWFVAIVKAQRKLKDSSIKVPILLLHSHQSFKPTKHTKYVKNSDTVLNVNDMIRLGPNLGKNVTLNSIENGMHDLFLSSIKARRKAFDSLFLWLENLI